MWRRLIIICTIGAIVGIVLSPMNPINSKLYKLAFLGCIGGSWLGLLLLSWKVKPVRLLLLALPFLLVVPFLLPAGDVDGEELRKDYVNRMERLDGVKYVWGGESARGIDCSGLPRRAYRDALLSYGVKHANGRAFRAYVEQWWHDASAKALGEGYRDYTINLSQVGNIREMSYDKLIPGDLAVTQNGIHVVVYLGDGKWIQADPGAGKVITLDGRDGDNAWFDTPISMHRWGFVTPKSNHLEQ